VRRSRSSFQRNTAATAAPCKSHGQWGKITNGDVSSNAGSYGFREAVHWLGGRERREVLAQRGQQPAELGRVQHVAHGDRQRAEREREGEGAAPDANDGEMTTVVTLQVYTFQDVTKPVTVTSTHYGIFPNATKHDTVTLLHNGNPMRSDFNMRAWWSPRV
jgi:hypothetical protein